MASDSDPLRAEFSPDTRLLRTIRAVVRSYCREVGFTDDVLVRGLLIAVTEVATNSMDALGRTGSREPVVVECALGVDGPRITIEDRGGGMREDVLERVRRGERIEDSEGLGVGLQLSRSLVSELSIDGTPRGTRVSVMMAREIAA